MIPLTIVGFKLYHTVNYNRVMAVINKLIDETINEVLRKVTWPKTYVNKDTQKVYRPHNEEERRWVYEDTPTYVYISGGEGSGKTTALVIKTLERLRRGMSGMMVSPNLPHFRRSLFPEFMRWLPQSVVIEEHRRYFHPAWEPYRSFDLVVHNELGGFSKLTCVGGDNPIMLEGPNLNFAALDEIRGMPNDEILKVLTGRIRVPGPNGEPPQLFCASTPKMHWMFDYFGPLRPNDPYEEFKRNSYVIRLSTRDNIEAGNIDSSYTLRGASLTEAQKRVRLDGEWGEEDNPEAFLEDMVQWDSLVLPNLPPLRTKTDPKANYSDKIVLGVDGAVTRDYFAIVAVTRSPFNKDMLAVRHVKVWAPNKNKIDFSEVEKWIVNFCKQYNVVTLVYDVYQLHDMMQRLSNNRVVWCQEFGQTKSRTLADQGLYDMILRREIFHNGDLILREHIQNADVKLDPDLHKRRLVKRAQSLKIDAAVALSMASFEAKRLNLA